jgi:hypothetical protein
VAAKIDKPCIDLQSTSHGWDSEMRAARTSDERCAFLFRRFGLCFCCRLYSLLERFETTRRTLPVARQQWRIIRIEDSAQG